jgi:hypothetical protein
VLEWIPSSARHRGHHLPIVPLGQRRISSTHLRLAAHSNLPRFLFPSTSSSVVNGQSDVLSDLPVYSTLSDTYESEVASSTSQNSTRRSPFQYGRLFIALRTQVARTPATFPITIELTLPVPAALPKLEETKPTHVQGTTTPNHPSHEDSVPLPSTSDDDPSASGGADPSR